MAKAEWNSGRLTTAPRPTATKGPPNLTCSQVTPSPGLGLAAGAVEVLVALRLTAHERSSIALPSPAMNSHHRISISPVPYGRHLAHTRPSRGPTIGASLVDIPLSNFSSGN
jgi:hypothetical protein